MSACFVRGEIFFRRFLHRFKARKRKRNLYIYTLPATVDADIPLVFLFRNDKASNRVGAIYVKH